MIIDFIFKHVYVRKKQLTCHFLGPPDRSGKGRLAADQLPDRGSGCDFLRSKSWPQLEAEIPDILQLEAAPLFPWFWWDIALSVGIPIEPGWYDWFEHHLPRKTTNASPFFFGGWWIENPSYKGDIHKELQYPRIQRAAASKVHCTVTPRAAFAHHWASIAHGHGSIHLFNRLVGRFSMHHG